MEKLSPSRLAYERELVKRFTSGGTLIFLHVPKCAGKTVNLVLQREAHRQKVCIRGYNSSLFTDATKEVDVLRGHLFYGIHRWMRKPYVYLTFLRDPVDRVISLYYYLRTHAQHVQGAFCRRLSLLDWAEREESAPYVSNVMTKTIAGTHSGHDGLGVFIGNHGMFYRNPLAAAKRHLREKFVFDFVSHFDRGYDRFKDMFSWSDEPYEAANVRSHSYPKRHEISIETVNVIKERNKQDLALMKYAARLLYDEEKICEH